MSGEIARRRAVEAGGVVYVLPRTERSRIIAKRIGRLAFGATYRWSSWSIGVDILRAGLLIGIGPVFLWVARIEQEASRP